MIGMLLLVVARNAVPGDDPRPISPADFATTIAELENIRRADPRAFEAADKDYLLARLAERDGELAVALRNFQLVVGRHSTLSPFALAHMSRIAASTGDLLLERYYLARLRMEHPGSLLSKGAGDRLALSALGSGDARVAISTLTSSGAVSFGQANVSDLRQRTALLGRAYMMTGSADTARQLFTGLCSSMPNPKQPDGGSQIAVRGLDTLDADDVAAGRPAAGLSVEDHMQRGAVYQFFRDFEAARAHYTAVGENFPASTSAPGALVQIGRGFAQSGDHQQAVAWFDKAIAKYPDSPDGKDAILGAAASESRLGNFQAAIKRYQAYIDRYPTDERVDRAYFNIIDVLRDSGDDQQALVWCSKAASVFKGKPAEAVATFTAARIYIAREQWQAALDRLEQLKGFPDLGGSTIPGGTNAAEVANLRSFLLGKLGVLAPGTTNGSSASRAVPTKFTPPTLSPSSLWRADPTAQRLIDLKLYDDAMVQISADKSVPPVELARYALLGDQAYRTLTYIEPILRGAPKDFPIDQIPRQQAEMLYPVAYRDELLRAAKPRGVDPRLLLAIIRQESRFQPDANSNAAARGLMQFISTTSNKIAGELGAAIDQDDLYDPETSILFGAQYAADLFKLFPNQPEAVVASYNAGEDNVARWIARSRSSDPARYVPEIMFTQTKDYVYKVMANYRAYCYLYDERLQPIGR